MFKQLLSIIFFSMLSCSSYAELPDPTRPSYPVNPQATTINVDGELKLKAIWISARSRWANINGIQAKQGQTIAGNIKIIKIRKNSVTINQNGNTKTLQLLQRPYHTQ